MLTGRRVVLGVSGSIAAYKAADLASKMVQAGAQVDVIMTREAAQFVTALTFRSLTHRPVVGDLFDVSSELAVEHVALAERADVVVVAPATANVIAKFAHGLADDSLTCTVLATAAPVVIAPAMDGNMYKSPATAHNLATLKERAKTLVELVEVGRFYFSAPAAYDDKAAQKFLTATGAERLERLIARLVETEFTPAALEAAYRELAHALDVKLVDLAQLTRLAVTGRTASPPIFEVLALLGRDETLARLRRARSMVA